MSNQNQIIDISKLAEELKKDLERAVHYQTIQNEDIGRLRLENMRLEAEIERLKEVIRTARDTAYSSSQDCPRCGFIDDLLTKALNESEGK